MISQIIKFIQLNEVLSPTIQWNDHGCKRRYLEDSSPFKGLITNWTIVYIANIMGSMFVAYFLAYKCGFFNSMPWAGWAATVANTKCGLDFAIPLGVFVANDPNTVANLAIAKVATGNLIGTAGIYNLLVTNLIPVTLGNIVGAVLFVAALCWYVYSRGSLCPSKQIEKKTPQH